MGKNANKKTKQNRNGRETMIYLSLKKLLVEYPHSNVCYFDLNNKLYTGKIILKDWKHEQVKIKNETLVTYFFLTHTLETKLLGKKYNIPIIHPRKVYGEYENKKKLKARNTRYRQNNREKYDEYQRKYRLSKIKLSQEHKA